MQVIFRRAARIRREYGLTIPVTEPMVDIVIESKGLTLVPNFPLVGRVHEVIIGRYIFLQKGLDVGYRKWLTMHALYHYMYHEGNQLFFAGREPVLMRRQERQATPSRDLSWLEP